MTPARIAELREHFDHEHPVNECLDEIERLDKDLTLMSEEYCRWKAEVARLQGVLDLERKETNETIRRWIDTSDRYRTALEGLADGESYWCERDRERLTRFAREALGR